MAGPERRPLARRIETGFETLLFASRWLLAPMYLGLAISLVVLLVKFTVSAADLVVHSLQGSQDHLIVGVLGLIDVSLVANLVLMVMFSGYESFVSRFDLGDHPDRPTWISMVGFGELKLKLITSIVAISAIHVLEDFMNAPTLTDRELAWRAGLHVMFVVTGVMLALMDRLGRAPPG